MALLKIIAFLDSSSSNAFPSIPMHGLPIDFSYYDSFIKIRIIKVALWYTVMLLQSLKELYIENNLLEYLPASVGSMPKLEVLDCRHNLLKQLPDEICHAQGEEA